MLDKADAAYAIPDRRAESQDLYLQIVTKYPDSRLAPAALYNAAYAAMENRKFDDALAMTKRFRQKYSDSDYMIDVLEVETDSHLLNNDAKAAEASATNLVNTYGNHPKVNLWRLNIGLAQFLQSNYQPALTTLQPIVDQLPSPEKKAEALHWIGCSQRKLSQTKAAIQTLTQSHQTNAQWRFADETLMRLSQAYFADKQGDNAKQVARKLIADFPKSKLLAEANYRMGEFDYEAGNYDGALKSYAAVIDNHDDSQFVPYALYGIGWSYLQKDQNDFASSAFEKLTNRFPEHKLTKQVAVGRAAANRGQGNADAAIADINSFLETEIDPAKRQEALYELGLAQIQKKDWPAVIQTFSKLIELAPSAPQADRYHYELAWAHKSNNDENSALEQFNAIAANFPTSNLAAEANFHIGQSAYMQKEYVNATKHFELASASEDPAVKEKAHYKLAWSYYKQKQFEKARIEFQKQLDTFPDGNLKADAMFMVSEALYETRKFDEALQRYKVAKPIIETSKTVSLNFKILTDLHGAQSANEAGQHDQAIQFASSLIDKDVEQYIKQDAQMEIGDAYRAMNEPEKAIEAYSKAAFHPGATAARSKCMMGEILFDQKEFAAAINEFKTVRYGFGGNKANDEIKKWQAFACYEAARCNMVQISTPNISDAEKKKFVSESK
jgi:TolA-binding protein